MTNGTPTSSGLSDNAAGALAYVTIIPSIIFLVMEPYNRNPFVKFHCWQNIFLCIACVALYIVDLVFSLIPFVGWILGPLIGLVLGLGIFILWLICIIKAFQGQKFVIPYIGPLAEKQAGS